MIIEYGYDRKVGAWNVVALDEEGNCIESEYCGDMKSVAFITAQLKDKYDITKVVKIKAY